MKAWQLEYDHPMYSIPKHAVVFAIDAQTAIKKFTKKSKLSTRAVTRIAEVPSTLQIS